MRGNRRTEFASRQLEEKRSGFFGDIGRGFTEIIQESRGPKSPLRPGNFNLLGNMLGNFRQTIQENPNGPQFPSTRMESRGGEGNALFSAPPTEAPTEETEAENAEATDQRIQRLLDQTAAITGLIDEVEQRPGQLSPQAQAALESAKGEAARMMEDLDKGIQQQRQSMQTIQAILQKQINPDKDVQLDQLLTKASEEDLKPGISEAWLEDLLTNADDPDKFRNMIDAEYLKQEALVEIENFVFQKEQLKDNLATFEEDLMKQDVVNNTRMDLFQFDPTPEGMANQGFVATMENVNTDHLDPLQEEALTEQLLGLFAQMQDPQFLAELSATTGPESQEGEESEGGLTQDMLSFLDPIAAQYELDAGQLKTSFMDGMNAAGDVVEQIAASQASGALKPNTLGTSYTIFQQASKFVSPENAEMLARSPLFHKFLEMSGGRTNFQAGGDLRGVGSLSEQVYNELGTPYESIKDDPNAQLDALVQYLLVGWSVGGDIDLRQAYVDMMQNGEWGTLPLLRHSRGGLQDMPGELPQFNPDVDSPDAADFASLLKGL